MNLIVQICQKNEHFLAFSKKENRQIEKCIFFFVTVLHKKMMIETVMEQIGPINIQTDEIEYRIASEKHAVFAVHARKESKRLVLY